MRHATQGKVNAQLTNMITYFKPSSMYEYVVTTLEKVLSAKLVLCPNP
jgi:hypothetical protein